MALATQPNSSMIPLGRNTRKQGRVRLVPGIPNGAVKAITLPWVSGDVCQSVIGVADCGQGPSCQNVVVSIRGGISSAEVPKGSESCQLSSQVGHVVCWG